MSHDTLNYFSEISQQFADSYKNSPDFLERVEKWAGVIQRFAPNVGTAIDLGCGPGIQSSLLLKKGLSVLAADGSLEMLNLCRKNNAQWIQKENFQTTQATLPELKEIQGKQVDVVICSSVLEYVPNLELAIQRMTELLAPNGVLMVSFPNFESFYRKYEVTRYSLLGSPQYFKYVENRHSPRKFREFFSKRQLKLVHSDLYGAGQGFVPKLFTCLSDRRRKNLLLDVYRK